MPDQLAQRRALRALLEDASCARIVDGRIAFVEPPKPCHGLACGCDCHACKAQRALIRDHRAAGRWPFTGKGQVKPKPRKRQPWDIDKKAA